jgi:hypothetical protein
MSQIFTLTTGRQVLAFDTPTPRLELVAAEPSDLRADERQEIAYVMVERWARWGRA